jgi:hypothetical protein
MCKTYAADLLRGVKKTVVLWYFVPIFIFKGSSFSFGFHFLNH